VDGVYEKDPRSNPLARRFDCISYDEVLRRGLAVMDLEAISLCRSHNLPIVIFSMEQQNALLRIARGEKVGTLVSGS
jgi:uridylate kinase